MMIKILIADMDTHLLKLLKVSLELDGFFVLTARDYEELLRTAERETPDLILFDLDDSFSVCTQLKERNVSSRIIVSAPNNSPEICREIGADGFLRKPYRTTTLGRELEEFLKK